MAATFKRYGRQWNEGTSLLTIELAAFKFGFTPATGGLGKAQHFKNLVNTLWPKGNRKHFVFHPWAERMLEAACQHKYLAVAGCASSGKTEFFALWGLINFICDPLNTLVLVTSTSLKEARQRIWGSLREFWTNSAIELPGKLVDSIGVIRLNDDEASQRSSITLIAGEKKKEKEAVGKMIGLKNKRVFLIADELPELSEAILEAAFSNLASNLEFQLIGIGNPKSYYDPFGILARPKAGWASITPLDDEWETERGYCIRFDGERSPNILAGRNIYPWMLRLETLADFRKNLGEKTAAYWRMIRGFWCPVASEHTVYSEADIAKFGGEEDVMWQRTNTRIAALDPSYTNGGDLTIAKLGRWGLTNEGIWVLRFDRTVELREDVTNKKEPRNFQIARQFMTLCKEEGVTPENAAVDATGAGGPFCDILAVLWGTNTFLRVSFGGKASDRPVNSQDPTPACERYANRVTEIWHVGLDFLRCGQLKGIDPALAKEMCSRHVETVKGTTMRMKVEAKKDMKARIGASPDLADASFILLDLVRQRHAAQASDEPTDLNRADQGASGYKAEVRRFRVPIKTLYR